MSVPKIRGRAIILGTLVATSIFGFFFRANTKNSQLLEHLGSAVVPTAHADVPTTEGSDCSGDGGTSSSSGCTGGCASSEGGGDGGDCGGGGGGGSCGGS